MAGPGCDLEARRMGAAPGRAAGRPGRRPRAGACQPGPFAVRHHVPADRARRRRHAGDRADADVARIPTPLNKVATMNNTSLSRRTWLRGALAASAAAATGSW